MYNLAYNGTSPYYKISILFFLLACLFCNKLSAEPEVEYNDQDYFTPNDQWTSSSEDNDQGEYNDASEDDAKYIPIQEIDSGHIPDYIVNAGSHDDPAISSTRIATYGILAESKRANIISQNLANANTVGSTPGADPYQRKVIFFQDEYDEKMQTNVVKVMDIGRDQSPYRVKYEPYHPAANQDGYVKYPNVDIMIESVDLKEAQRTLQANTNSFSIGLANQKTILSMMR